MAAVAALALVACESQPSAKRVAEDIVETLAENEEEEACMKAVIEDLGKDELEQIGDGVNENDPDAVAALRAFEASLEDCR